MSRHSGMYIAWRSKRRTRGIHELQDGMGGSSPAALNPEGDVSVKAIKELPSISLHHDTSPVTSSATRPVSGELLLQETSTWRQYSSSFRNNRIGQKASLGSASSAHLRQSTNGSPPGGLQHTLGDAHEQHHNGEVPRHDHHLHQGLAPGNTGASQFQSSYSSTLEAPLSPPGAGRTASDSVVYDPRQAWTTHISTTAKGSTANINLKETFGEEEAEAFTSHQKLGHSGLNPLPDNIEGFRNGGLLYNNKARPGIPDARAREHVSNTLSLSEKNLKEWTSDSIADHILGDSKAGEGDHQVVDLISDGPTSVSNINRTGIIEDISESVSDILTSSNSSSSSYLSSLSGEFGSGNDPIVTDSYNSLAEENGWLNSTRTLLVSNTTNLTLPTGGGGGGETGHSISNSGVLHRGRGLNTSGLTPESGGTTPFPGYLDIRDFSWDLSEVPDSLSMFSNLSDCLQWSTNGSYGCYYGGFGNVTNVSLGGAGGTALGGSGGDGSGEDVYLSTRYWALLLVFFPLLTLVGNIMVVTSVYRERALRTVTNYFIVSLAIADIAVALFVMPLAIYTEVNNGRWRLGNILCDAWVALDVMGCTSSILNLTAISVDRFIAVTQPIRYAKHKHSKRVHVMLALTWIVSIAISSPIALGMNYTEARRLTPELCVFYNSEFLICSSMGSFYIPCIIMLVLYWRIFRTIRLRARKQAMKMTKQLGNDRHMRNVIENKAQVSAPEEENPHQVAQHAQRRQHCPVHGSPNSSRLASHNQTNHETSFINVTTTDTGEDDSHCADVIKSPLSEDTDHVIPNDKSTDFMLSPQSEDSHGEYREGDTGYSPPVAVVVETHFTQTTSPTSQKILLSPQTRKTVLGFKNHAAAKLNFLKREDKESPRKMVTKFNFHLRHSKKKKQSSAIRRERKATKTLAIVLGVFLLCWLPFFTVNVMHAICLKLDLMHKKECNIDTMLISFFTWLGYINSFLNPVIYTIFNVEFRKAFKNILLNPLGKRK